MDFSSSGFDLYRLALIVCNLLKGEKNVFNQKSNYAKRRINRR